MFQLSLDDGAVVDNPLVLQGHILARVGERRPRSDKEENDYENTFMNDGAVQLYSR